MFMQPAAAMTAWHIVSLFKEGLLMKKTYTTPEITVEELLKQDVLCASVTGENRTADYRDLDTFVFENL